MMHLDDLLILAQAHIITRFTGAPLRADQPPADTPRRDRALPELDDGGCLLELYGIPANRYRHASLFELASELAHGHMAVVYTTDPAWRPDAAHDSLARGAAGRPGDRDSGAVIVVAIDTADPTETWIISVEPGRGEAVTRQAFGYFLWLWRTSDITVVATQEPAPSWLPEMAGFDYDVGHLPALAGLSFEQFIALADSPDLLHAHLDRVNALPDHHTAII